MDIKKELWIIDSTLRDGEQAPGVAFSKKEKLHIARMLDTAGIDEIEAGTPAMGEEECRMIRQIAAMPRRARISVWCRALEQDIVMAAKTRAEGIHIACPLSEIQLASMHKEWEAMKDMLPRMVEMANCYFPYVSVGAQDASRCGIERLFDFIDVAESAGVSRIRIADTVGILTPLATMRLMNDVLEAYPSLPIDFHGHNDLGMATANAVTAWQAGASSLSVTVNGLGERAGNAALEEVLMAISLTEKQTTYATSVFSSLCEYVAYASKRPIPQGKAICGKMVFSHESGIHAKSALADIRSFQAFDGRSVGRESSRTLFGKHSGKGAVADFLHQQNMEVTDREVRLLTAKIRDMAQACKRNIYPEEILMAYGDMKHAY
ncbi:MAG: homocitrate synthase [Tannerellaceae bacterium]|jgi:homocitrate synthase NifV|nr:homocitrate synthase [Tannerellaceae bacterium]